MDNQQQQQMNIAEKRPVGDLLLLGLGFSVIGLVTFWGLHWAAPEIFGRDAIIGPGVMPG